jgi:hypothetical protein
MVVTPRAESARALAMGLAALRVRTRLGPERDVTPVATLPGSAERDWLHEETHRTWHRSAVVSRPR